jgi:hypothetical protein
MSKNSNKITKALAEKGYRPINMMWTPVGHACEMSGPEGGWYIEYGLLEDLDDEAAYIDVILAYSTKEAIEEIDSLIGEK